MQTAQHLYVSVPKTNPNQTVLGNKNNWRSLEQIDTNFMHFSYQVLPYCHYCYFLYKIQPAFMDQWVNYFENGLKSNETRSLRTLSNDPHYLQTRNESSLDCRLRQSEAISCDRKGALFLIGLCSFIPNSEAQSVCVAVWSLPKCALSGTSVLRRNRNWASPRRVMTGSSLVARTPWNLHLLVTSVSRKPNCDISNQIHSTKLPHFHFLWRKYIYSVTVKLSALRNPL